MPNYNHLKKGKLESGNIITIPKALWGKFLLHQLSFDKKGRTSLNTAGIMTLPLSCLRQWCPSATNWKSKLLERLSTALSHKIVKNEPLSSCSWNPFFYRKAKSVWPTHAQEIETICWYCWRERAPRPLCLLQRYKGSLRQNKFRCWLRKTEWKGRGHKQIKHKQDTTVNFAASRDERTLWATHLKKTYDKFLNWGKKK